MSRTRQIKSGHPLGALALLFLVSCGGSGGGENPRPGGFKEDGGRAVDRPPGTAALVTIAPPDTGDGWVVSTPDAQNIDGARLKASLDRWLSFGTGGLDAVVVVRNDQLVAEGYFNGYDRNTLHDVRSVTKSITSALTGIAIDRGVIGLDDTIAQHIPDFESYPGIDDRKRSIRIRHLVNMQSGMDCDDGSDFSPGNESRMYGKDDWVRFALGIPMAVAPGERMSYCSAGVMLLGHVIATRAGTKLEDFAAANLFGPLGIQNVRWLHSPMGVTNANSTFQIRPRDLAKFGFLYLNGGMWQGNSVVPQGWIEASFARNGLIRGQGYGLLWWKTVFVVRGAEQEVLYASGNGGNLIFVVPSERLVVVINASNYNGPGPSYAFMRDDILRTLR